MLPILPGPDPRTFVLLAIAIAVALGGSAVALIGILGWGASGLLAIC